MRGFNVLYLPPVAVVEIKTIYDTYELSGWRKTIIIQMHAQTHVHIYELDDIKGVDATIRV